MPLFGNNKAFHTTPVPTGVTRDEAVGMLHNHVFFISCDPHMTDFKELPTEDIELPEAVQAARTGAPTHRYTVTDRLHALPAGIWDSDVVSTYEFTDLKTGVFVRIRSPLSVVMDTIWEIKDTEEGDGLLLSEDVFINCSILLVSIVKGQVESGWKGIHQKMIGKLVEVK